MIYKNNKNPARDAADASRAPSFIVIVEKKKKQTRGLETGTCLEPRPSLSSLRRFGDTVALESSVVVVTSQSDDVLSPAGPSDGPADLIYGSHVI